MNKCLVCKKSFTPKSHTTGKYCSHLCSSKARIGSHTKGHPAWNKGLRGAMPTPWNKGTKGVMVAWNKGIIKIYTKNCKTCGKEFQKPYVINTGRWVKVKFCSLDCSAKGNGAWKGGITPANTKIRNSDEYIKWAKSVKERDNFECQICGEIGGRLRSNHIKKFADYPEIRLEPTNGITICTKCDYQWVFRNEPEWENYFNFNLTNRGIL